MHCFKALNMLVSWHHGQLIANHHRTAMSYLNGGQASLPHLVIGCLYPIHLPSEVSFCCFCWLCFCNFLAKSRQANTTESITSLGQIGAVHGLAARLIQAPPGVAATKATAQNKLTMGHTIMRVSFNATVQWKPFLVHELTGDLLVEQMRSHLPILGFPGAAMRGKNEGTLQKNAWLDSKQRIPPCNNKWPCEKKTCAASLRGKFLILAKCLRHFHLGQAQQAPTNHVWKSWDAKWRESQGHILDSRWF